MRNDLIASLEEEGMSVTEWTDEPHTYYPEHAHAKDEVLVVVEGSLTMVIEGRRRELGPGDRVELASGAMHTAKVGPDGARYLVAR